jgi:hypothetical protein
MWDIQSIFTASCLRHQNQHDPSPFFQDLSSVVREQRVPCGIFPVNEVYEYSESAGPKRYFAVVERMSAYTLFLLLECVCVCVCGMNVRECHVVHACPVGVSVSKVEVEVEMGEMEEVSSVRVE